MKTQPRIESPPPSDTPETPATPRKNLLQYHKKHPANRTEYLLLLETAYAEDKAYRRGKNRRRARVAESMSKKGWLRQSETYFTITNLGISVLETPLKKKTAKKVTKKRKKTTRKKARQAWHNQHHCNKGSYLAFERHPGEPERDEAMCRSKDHLRHPPRAEREVQHALQKIQEPYIPQQVIFLPTTTYMIADFYLPRIRTVLEVDGETHDTPEAITWDQKKKRLLSQQGIQMVSIRNERVYSSTQQQIKEHIEETISQCTKPKSTSRHKKSRT